MYIVDREYYFIVQVHGALLMTLLEMLIIGVDNSSSSHSDNCKNNFILLSEIPHYGVNGSPQKFWMTRENL